MVAQIALTRGSRKRGRIFHEIRDLVRLNIPAQAARTNQEGSRISPPIASEILEAAKVTSSDGEQKHRVDEQYAYTEEEKAR